MGGGEGAEQGLEGEQRDCLRERQSGRSKEKGSPYRVGQCGLGSLVTYLF